KQFILKYQKKKKTSINKLNYFSTTFTTHKKEEVCKISSKLILYFRIYCVFCFKKYRVSCTIYFNYFYIKLKPKSYNISVQHFMQLSCMVQNILHFFCKMFTRVINSGI
ncbi:hypothetical protein C0J52_19070, partial [Blattella germanica]